MTATRLRARYGAVPTEEARDDDDESPTASLLGGTAVASDASPVSEELSSRSFGLGGGLATGPTSPVPVSAEKAKRLAHLRQKYRQQDSAPDLSHAAGQSPPSSLSVDVRSVRIDLRPRGSGRAVERRESFRRQGSGGKSAASSSDAVELTPRWSAYSLPAGVHPSSLVLVKDFWNAKLGQLTIHAGQAWADEAERGPQFTAFRADVPPAGGAAPPPDGAVAVYDFWNPNLRQLTFHTGGPRQGEERHSVQFYAYPADGGASPPQGTVAVYEYFNIKLKRVTAHPGGPWPDETRGAHDVLFHALPAEPPAPPPPSPPPPAPAGGACFAGSASSAAAGSGSGREAQGEGEWEAEHEVEVFENERWSSVRSEWGSFNSPPTALSSETLAEAPPRDLV